MSESAASDTPKKRTRGRGRAPAAGAAADAVRNAAPTGIAGKPAGAAARARLNPAQQALGKLGLVRAIDLALHLPLRYEDETRITPLAAARDGMTLQVEGEIVASEVIFRPRRQLVATLADGAERLRLRFFTFYPSQQKALAVGRRVRVRGVVKSAGLWGGWEMVHPVYRAAGAPLPDTLTPVYPTVAGLPQAYLRVAVLSGLARADLSATVPSALAARFPVLERLPALDRALHRLHQPAPDADQAALESHHDPAWRRLKFEELLAQQLAQHAARRARAQLRAPALAPRPGASGAPPLYERLLAALPFALTGAQRRVVAEIAHDLARNVPMHRLLQGDVGSGKTVVAALAAALAVGAGWQCALMVPTEILAEQHLRRLVGWLEPLGVPVAWLTGALRKSAREAMLAAIADGAAGLVVGTHAVIQEQVRFHRLGLVVIDEQHRFGVAQRLALRGKLDTPALEPHFLMMSATPIPRTLAMSYYADLDVSTLDELPPGRTPVVTRVFAEARRGAVIEHIRALVAAGRQVYWVCPLIDESEALDLTNATATHRELTAALPGVAVGLLHSRMAPAEKHAVMADFAAGATLVLVATTVIEVGVDVPNASLMVVEHAERFGLSQLHQLRGRVGRGTAAATCVLLYGQPLGAAGKARLKAMLETTDGFEIARRDLDIRGPGEFLGARQSGDALLRFADLAEDGDLLDAARAIAPEMLAQYPDAAARHVARWLGTKSDYLNA